MAYQEENNEQHSVVDDLNDKARQLNDAVNKAKQIKNTPEDLRKGYQSLKAARAGMGAASGEGGAAGGGAAATTAGGVAATEAAAGGATASGVVGGATAAAGGVAATAGGAVAAEGVGAASIGVGISGGWVLGIATIVILFIILIAAIFVAIFGGGSVNASDQSSLCKGGITAVSDSATTTSPVLLTATDCHATGSGILTFLWTTDDAGGKLSNPTEQSTTYTPSSNSITQAVISVYVCSSSVSSDCSTYDYTINVSGATPPPTSSCQTPNKVFYCQFNPTWHNIHFDDSTIGRAGCGPTSMAMIMSSYCQVHKPPEIASAFDANNWSWKNGNRACSGGADCQGAKLFSQWTGKNAWFKSMGFEFLNKDVSGTYHINYVSASNYLAAHYLLLAGSFYHHKFTGGHSFVVDGVRKNSTGEVEIHVRDPNDCSSKYIWMSDYMYSTDSGGNRHPGWYYLMPVRAIQ